MRHSMTRQVLNLALANPENITPQTGGKAWERFAAGNITLRSTDGLIDGSQFVFRVGQFFQKLSEIDDADFYFFWFGIQLHPLFSPSGLVQQISLIDEVVAGRLARDSEVAEFCAQRGIPDVELMQKKASALAEFVHFLLRLEEVDFDLLLEMAAEEYHSLSRLSRYQPYFPSFRR